MATISRSGSRKKSGGSSKLRPIKKPVTAYLEPQQPRELKALSARTMVPLQVYVCEGIDLALAKYAKRDG